jgi:hypothetical protein
MAYSDFSLESALVPTTLRRPVKLQGVHNAVAALRSSSTSTEEFIQGAVSSLGNADRMIMYVNGSLEALSDRLQCAAKIAKAVNTSKAHGAEGFQNVPMLDPWAYAIEGKASEFFSRIWQAIKTACRRVIDAIAYVIKWIGNAIASADVRGQIKDYKFYTTNKARIEKYTEAAKTDKVEFNSLAWKIKVDGLAKLISNAAGHYAKSTEGSADVKKFFESASRANFASMHDAKDFTKAFSNVFGTGTGDATKAYQHLSSNVEKLRATIDEDLKKNISEIFGGSKDLSKAFGARDLIMKAVTSGEKKTITVGEMKKLSGEFGVLSEQWLTKNVKEVIATTHKHQKEFTEFTKLIDKVSANFAKTLGDKDNGFKAINNLTAKLANDRIRYNSFWSNMKLELETVALRYRKFADLKRVA